MALLFVLVLSFALRVLADCECGYSATVGSTDHIFTDILETDFLHLSNVSLDTDWVRQNYSVSAVKARGSYGENATVGNVLSNPLIDNSSWSGAGELAGDAGLQLFVRGGVPADGYIPVAEMDSRRNDLMYGSYRAAIKLANVSGTCGAFYWVCLVLPCPYSTFIFFPLSSLHSRATCLKNLALTCHSTSMIVKRLT
jgi:hypothetical protein